MVDHKVRSKGLDFDSGMSNLKNMSLEQVDFGWLLVEKSAT